MSELWERQRDALAREQADPAELAIETDPAADQAYMIGDDGTRYPVQGGTVTPGKWFSIQNGAAFQYEFQATPDPLYCAPFVASVPTRLVSPRVTFTVEIDAEVHDIPALLRRLADQLEGT